MRGTPYVHADFRGGLNTKAANYLLEDNQCRFCVNVQSSTTGAVVKRNGITQVAAGTGLTDMTGAKTIQAVEATGSDHELVMTDSQVFKVAGNIITPVASGFANGLWTAVEATAQDSQGPVFLSNGAVSQEWDGTTLSSWTMDANSTLGAENTSVPAHKYSLVHESRIVIAGVSDPSTIYWSEVEVGVGTKPRTWTIENQQLFDPDDGDVVTGLGRVGSNMLVFKKHKVFVVYDLNTGATRRLTSNIGCVSHRSIVETPNGTFFLADNGVYVTNGSSVELVSDVITPTILGLSDGLNATAMYFRNHVYWSFPSDGLILDYDLVLKSWWLHSVADGKAITDFSTGFSASTEQPYCVTSDGLVGLMFEPGVYQDFGESYEWIWRGPWLAPGQARMVYPAVRKRMKALRVDGQGQALLTLCKDFNDTESAVTPQGADGTPITNLFGTTISTTFGPAVSDGTYFGDYSSTQPANPVVIPSVFGDEQGPSQARIWGQGVARSWALTFKNSSDDLTTPKAAIIQNYTIFMQERNV